MNIELLCNECDAVLTGTLVPTSSGDMKILVTPCRYCADRKRREA